MFTLGTCTDLQVGDDGGGGGGGGGAIEQRESMRICPFL